MNQSDGPPARRAAKRGPSVIFVVALLMAVPLAVSAVLVGDRIGELQQRRSTLEQLAEATSNVASLSTAQASLAEERILQGALAGMDRFGLEPSLVEMLIDVDIEAEAVRAQERFERELGEVDAALLADTRIAGRLASGLSDLQVLSDDYRAAFDVVESWLVDERARVDQLTTILDGAEAVSVRQGDLTAATGASVSASRIVSNLFSLLVVSDRTPASELNSLYSHRADFESQIEHLPEALRQRVETDPSMVAVQARVDAAIAIAARDGVDAAVLGVGDDLLAAIPSLGSYFVEARDVFELHRTIVDDARADLSEAVDAADAAARADIRTSFMVLVLLVIAAALAMWLAMSMIVAPLRRLVAGVQRLEAGLADTRVEPSGVREVRAVADALNGAARGLHVAETRSRQLASGVLPDGDALDTASAEAEAEASLVGASMRASLDELSAAIREREELRRQLEWEASHDALTGLLNRRGFQAELDRPADHPHPPRSLLYLDLDGFKAVNDAYGHHVGDDLLVAVADRLREVVGDVGSVARLGGDEFAVLVEHGSAQPETIARLVKASIDRPYAVSGHAPSISVSIGFATDPGSMPVTEFMQQADSAAYYAKVQGAPAAVAYGDVVARWATTRRAATAPIA